MLGALLRAILPDKPAPRTARPIVQTKEPEGPGRGDGFVFTAPAPFSA